MSKKKGIINGRDKLIKKLVNKMSDNDYCILFAWI